MLNWFEKNVLICVKFKVFFGVYIVFVGVSFVVIYFVGGSFVVFGVVGVVFIGIVGIVLVLFFKICISYVNMVLCMEVLVVGDIESVINYIDYKDCVGCMIKVMVIFCDNVMEL